MATVRRFLGLALSSRCDTAAANIVETTGIGLSAQVRSLVSYRTPLDSCRLLRTDQNETMIRQIADGLTQAVRGVSRRIDGRSPLAIGLFDSLPESAWIAARLAEQTGIAVISGFAIRDHAAGGNGRLLTTLADSLIFSEPHEERLLLHLGSVSSLVHLSPKCSFNELLAFESGPGIGFLDELITLGTRGRASLDTAGTIAVQGRVIEPLLESWLKLPFFQRTPPKTVPAELLGTSLIHAAFERVREAGGTLNDLLCTATHWIARAIEQACTRWVPASCQKMILSGRGARNGFLWQRLGHRLPGKELLSLDELGVPGSQRTAVAAAILAAFFLDGVPGNLPHLTGATGSRVLGHISPGDERNWSQITRWIADQMTYQRGLDQAA